MDKNFEKLLTAFAEAADTKTNAEDFVKSFEAILGIFLSMKADNEKERAELKSFAETALTTLKENTSTFTSRLADTLTARINEKLASLKDGYTPVKGVDYFDGEHGHTPSDEELTALITPLIPAPLQGSPDTPEQIVSKLESLKDDDRLDYSAIKNIPKHTDSPAVIGGHGPLWGLQDVEIAGITAGQSIQWDGVRWIPYTPSGTGGTSVYNEVVSGDTNTFTLAHTPTVNTVRVYANGQRLTPTTDFTIAGAIITTISAWSAGQITSDYAY